MRKILAAALALLPVLLTFAACAGGADTAVSAANDQTESTAAIEPTQTEPFTASAASDTTTETQTTETTAPVAERPYETTEAAAPDVPFTQTTAAPDGRSKTDDASYPFTALTYQTSSSVRKTFPEGLVIADASACSAYLQQNRDTAHFRNFRVRDAAFPTPEEALAQYDDAWFASHRLVVLEIEVGSGSYRYTVDGVSRTLDGAVTVAYTRTAPPVGTADMAYWLFLIEVDSTDFSASDVVRGAESIG